MHHQNNIVIKLFLGVSKLDREWRFRLRQAKLRQGQSYLRSRGDINFRLKVSGNFKKVMVLTIFFK